MFTFGAFLKSSNFSMLESFLSTFFAFALPGQFVMADMLIAGGNLLNVFFAVVLTNLRLLPMTINMMPILENKKIKRWKYYLICHLIAVTAWINMLTVYKNIKKEKRFQYFFGLGFCLWITSIICTVFGFVCSNFVNEKILIGLVFFNAGLPAEIPGAFFVSVAPCGVTSIVLCSAYNVSPENIIKAIFVSTIASIGTIFFAIKYLTL